MVPSGLADPLPVEIIGRQAALGAAATYLRAVLHLLHLDLDRADAKLPGPAGAG